MIAAARDGTLRVLRAATGAGLDRVVMTSAANAARPTSYREAGVTDETLWTDPAAPGLDAYGAQKPRQNWPPGPTWTTLLGRRR
jgi:hypothetical protein